MARRESEPLTSAGALHAELGDDLVALLSGLPSRVVCATPITSLNARRSSRATFRIALADGSELKARRFDSEFEAVRVARLTRHLNDPLVPAAIAQRGATLIEPWIEGRPLVADDLAPNELHACGALLAAIHLTSAPPGFDGEVAVARREREGRLTENLRGLLAAGRLDAEFARRAHAAAEPVPSMPVIGLIHGDFCPENLVRTQAGRIFSVDNETMRFEALDYDLARSWHRWPMSAVQARSFLDGYASHRSPDSFLRHFSYWAICALVDATMFRSSAGIDGVDALLACLDAFMREKPAFPSS
jgi:hypothetical protein